MSTPSITRTCGECSECCKGWLTSTIYDRHMSEGKPCHFLGAKGCAIYKDRPEDPCKAYKCEWLKDDGTLYPEWLRPDQSKVILTQRTFGPDKSPFLEVKECGETISAQALNWIYLFASERNLQMQIQVAGAWSRRGSPEFSSGN